MLSTAYDMIKAADLEDCFRRMVCDISTGNNTFNVYKVYNPLDDNYYAININRTIKNMPQDIETNCKKLADQLCFQ